MLKSLANRFYNKFATLAEEKSEVGLLATGALLAKQQMLMNSSNINDYEFKIFSQFGDDGLIQYLVRNLTIENETFIEFGVEDYSESNTRFLLMNNNWRGFVMDGSTDAMNKLRSNNWYWKYDLRCTSVFIDKDNINGLIASSGFSNLGLLHIDIDGNDYHIFETMDLSKLNPSIVIIEYNSVFGKDRAISTPYDKSFIRTQAHYSNLYWGASVAALNHIAERKGYALVCCNLAGNNAYFVRKDLLNDKVTQRTVDQAFVTSRYRESRNADGSLSLLAGNDRLEHIKGLKVLNVITNQIETL